MVLCCSIIILIRGSKFHVLEVDKYLEFHTTNFSFLFVSFPFFIVLWHREKEAQQNKLTQTDAKQTYLRRLKIVRALNLIRTFGILKEIQL